MDWVARFLIGGTIVAVFALIGDVLKPKGFPGLFGAAHRQQAIAIGLSEARRSGAHVHQRVMSGTAALSPN
jgi:hypothetical protein